MIASKLDELDYNLAQASALIKCLKESAYLEKFQKQFTSEDMASCEEEILKILKWNLHQVHSF